MPDNHDVRAVVAPPAGLLRRAASPPSVTTVLPQVRSDADLPLADDAPVGFLNTSGQPGVGIIHWSFELSWVDAQWIQLWLAGQPNGVAVATREEALKLFIENNIVAGNPPTPFLEYIGTFLSTDASHARYTILIVVLQPVPWEEYRQAWVAGLDQIGQPGTPWRDELVAFLKRTAGLATSNVELLRRAFSVGDLTDVDGQGSPRYPLIKVLIS